jgi:hypothetical protein
MSESDQDTQDDEQRHAEPESTSLWKHPGLAVVAALIALLGLVWRCA